MIGFIDEHRQVFGVGPICEVIEIAPSTYYEAKRQLREPERRPARRRRDEALKIEIRRIYDENQKVYGVRKVWIQANRVGGSRAFQVIPYPQLPTGRLCKTERFSWGQNREGAREWYACPHI